jgi:hypothetical protein
MLNTQYKVHNTSWGKFLGYALEMAFFRRKVLVELRTDHDIKKAATAVHYLLNSLYFGSNLHDQYKYNKSLEYSFNVKINDEVKTINASPQYFDSYTAYNSLLLGSCLLSCARLLLQSPTLGQAGILTNYAGILTWAYSSNYYNDFNFTDSKGNRYTAEEIQKYLLENDSPLQNDDLTNNNDLIDCN